MKNIHCLFYILLFIILFRKNLKFKLLMQQFILSSILNTFSFTLVYDIILNNADQF